MFWECTKRRKDTKGGEAHISEEKKHVEAKEAKGEKNLMMRKFILKPEKEVEEPVQ
jgi:hypothetical protein